MDDNDDALREKLRDLYARAAIITDAESLDELGLIMLTFFNEATIFLPDSESPHDHMLALIAVIVRHLSEDDHVVFAAYLDAALKGYNEGADEPPYSRPCPAAACRRLPSSSRAGDPGGRGQP